MVYNLVFVVFLCVCVCVCVLLHSGLHAGAGWTGVGAVSEAGMGEPGQGMNGAVLANQTGMSTAGYHPH